MRETFRIPHVEDYERFIGAEAVDRIMEKAKKLQDIRVAHINSTLYGGGVATLLSPLTLLLKTLGIDTEWRVIQGSPDFFNITKKMHNALQGGEINLSRMKQRIYEDVVYENSLRNILDHDRVIIHDPQPLSMIEHYAKKGPWIWRCHIDLTDPDKELWRYLSRFVEKYDAVVFTLKEYRRKLKIPQVFIMPAIDPFSIGNREMTQEQVIKRLDHYKIPMDLPIVTQISRFDIWKDPGGVIEAFKIARREVDATLVLLGNIAADDPEGEKVYQSLMNSREERIIILSREDSALVNALQRKSAVVLQKSLREGFGLTVSEAMWKGAAVIGSKVGGIPSQIDNGRNGFLVSSIKETAARIVQLIKNKELREKLGHNARETVRKKFLLTRMLEDDIDLLASFDTIYRFRK